MQTPDEAQRSNEVKSRSTKTSIIYFFPFTVYQAQWQDTKSQKKKDEKKQATAKRVTSQRKLKKEKNKSAKIKKEKMSLSLFNYTLQHGSLASLLPSSPLPPFLQPPNPRSQSVRKLNFRQCVHGLAHAATTVCRLAILIKLSLRTRSHQCRQFRRGGGGGGGEGKVEEGELEVWWWWWWEGGSRWNKTVVEVIVEEVRRWRRSGRG